MFITESLDKRQLGTHAHSKKFSTKGNKYYDDIHERLKKDKELYKSVMEDGKVKVKELGGWECSKCHY